MIVTCLQERDLLMRDGNKVLEQTFDSHGSALKDAFVDHCAL